MRVGLVSTEYPDALDVPCGGLGQYVARTAAALAGAGHEVEVFVPALPGRSLPAHVHAIPRAWPRWAVWASRVVLHRMAAAVDVVAQGVALGDAVLGRHRQRPFDVVQHAHLGATALWSPPGIPLVVRLSSWQPLCTAAGDGAVGGCQAAVVHALERRALRRARMVYAPSRFIAEHVGASLGCAVRVLENPFRLECAPEAQIDAGGPYILTAGPISRLKGAEVVAAVAAAVLSRHPHVRWILAGREAQPGSVERIRRASGGHADRIIHVGHVGHPRLYALMHGAQAVVLPSLVDNLPNTCLEAMALGCCVVGAHPTGMEQVIDDGVSGLLVRAGDAAGFEAAVHRVLDAPEVWRRGLGIAAMDSVARLHPDRMIPRLINLYREALR